MRWMDEIKTTIEHSWAEIIELVQDRTQWRNLIKNKTKERKRQFEK